MSRHKRQEFRILNIIGEWENGHFLSQLICSYMINTTSIIFIINQWDWLGNQNFSRIIFVDDLNANNAIFSDIRFRFQFITMSNSQVSQLNQKLQTIYQCIKFLMSLSLFFLLKKQADPLLKHTDTKEWYK